MVMIDVCDRRFSMEIIRDEEGVERTSEQRRMRYAFQAAGKYVSVAYIIKLVKIANILIVIVRTKVTFRDTMKRPLNHLRYFMKAILSATPTFK